MKLIAYKQRGNGWQPSNEIDNDKTWLVGIIIACCLSFAAGVASGILLVEYLIHLK